MSDWRTVTQNKLLPYLLDMRRARRTGASPIDAESLGKPLGGSIVGPDPLDPAERRRRNRQTVYWIVMGILEVICLVWFAVCTR